jgi:hypothetical protein
MDARTTTNDVQPHNPTGRNSPAPMPGAGAGSAVMNVVVRVAGAVPVRLDMSHAGTAEQQVGLSLGTVLIYLRTAVTARAVAEGWAGAALSARGLSVAVVGRRPLPVGPSGAAVLVRLAGIPRVTAALVAARPGTEQGPVLRVQVGPVTWEVCDATAFTSLLRGWRQAARLLDPTGEQG